MKKTILQAAIVALLAFAGCESETGNNKNKAQAKTTIPVQKDRVNPNVALLEKAQFDAETKGVRRIGELRTFDSVGSLDAFTQKHPNGKIYGEKETKDSIVMLVLDLEKLSRYKLDTVKDDNGRKTVHYSMKIIVAMFNLDVWLDVHSRNLYYLSIHGIGSYKSISLGDEGCDGMLHPSCGGDYYKFSDSDWTSTYEFCQLPQAKLEFANQKEMEIVRYLSAFIRYSYQ